MVLDGREWSARPPESSSGRPLIHQRSHWGQSEAIWHRYVAALPDSSWSRMLMIMNDALVAAVVPPSLGRPLAPAWMPRSCSSSDMTAAFMQ